MGLVHRVRDWGTRLLHVLGWRFIVFLTFAQMLGKGTLYVLADAMMLPLFKARGIDAAQLQIFDMLVMIPWSTKPLIGMASDVLVLFGWRKRPWLVLGVTVGTTAAALMIPVGPTVLLVFCFASLQFQLALFDLLSEAKYSELRNKHPEVGSDVVTLANGMQTLGALIALSFAGVLSDAQLFYVAFIIMLSLAAVQAGPTLLGWLPEDREMPRFSLDRAMIREHWRILAVVGFCGACSIVSSLVVTLASPLAGLVTALVLVWCCLLGCWFAFPPAVLRIAIYQALSTMSQPSMSTVLAYFYTADATCLPDGPHFSYTYFITYVGTAAILASFAGVWIYHITLSGLRFRTVLLLTNVLSSLASITDLVIIMRWNIALGITDDVAYIAGQAVLEPMIGMLNWIPGSALIAMTVVPKLESSTYAYMAGLANFSRMVARLSGSVLYRAVGIVTVPSTTGETCDFSALPWLVVACHTLAPLAICIPLTWVVPDVGQRDALGPTEEDQVELVEAQQE